MICQHRCAIIAFGDPIEAEAADRLNAENRSYLARMKIAAARMDHLIVDVFSCGHIVRGELTLHPVNVSDLLSGVVETYPSLQPPRAKIHVPHSLLWVQGNEAALTQCFSNLLNNAVEFVKPGQVPHINIAGERNGQLSKVTKLEILPFFRVVSEPRA